MAEGVGGASIRCRRPLRASSIAAPRAFKPPGEPSLATRILEYILLSFCSGFPARAGIDPRRPPRRALQGPAPRIGERSAIILAKLGIDAVEIARLATAKVIRVAKESNER
jgi:hypothetical protein